MKRFIKIAASSVTFFLTVQLNGAEPPRKLHKSLLETLRDIGIDEDDVRASFERPLRTGQRGSRPQAGGLIRFPTHEQIRAGLDDFKREHIRSEFAEDIASVIYDVPAKDLYAEDRPGKNAIIVEVRSDDAKDPVAAQLPKTWFMPAVREDLSIIVESPIDQAIRRQRHEASFRRYR